MTVKFSTNIDHYKTNCFPTNLTQVPQRGDLVAVNQGFEQHFMSKKLPLFLEVVSVIWCEAGAVCELHYRKFDIEMARIQKINLF